MKTEALEGELTIFTAAELKPTLLGYLYADDEIEINLAQVTEIDTAGLQLLILLKREAAKIGKSLHYVMHSKTVLDLLELANVVGSFGDQIVIAHNEV